MKEKFELPTGINIWIPGSDLKSCLEMAVTMWIKECKQEVEDFAYDIRRKRDGLYKDNGMSRTGNLKEYLEVPPGLAKRILQMTNKDWMLDTKICGMIKQLIPDLMPYKGKDGSKISIDRKII